MLEFERTVEEEKRFPAIRPEGVQWRTVGDELCISLDLVNEGLEESQPGILHVEGAAFGAFVPGTPLAARRVGRIGPRRVHRVEIHVPRADVDRLNPRALRDNLALLGAEEWAGNLNLYFDGASVDGRTVKVEFGFKSVRRVADPLRMRRPD